MVTARTIVSWALRRSARSANTNTNPITAVPTTESSSQIAVGIPARHTAAGALKAAEIDGRVLVVLDPEDQSSRSVDRAFRNLEKAAFALHGSLATYDVLVSDAVIFTSSAFDKLSTRVKEAQS